MERVYRYERQPGYTKIVGPGQGGLERLEFGLLRIPRDEEYQSRLEGREAMLVILSGDCTVEVDGESWNLSRVNVFAEPAMAVYVPRHRQYTVVTNRPSSLAVFVAISTRDFMPRLVEGNQVVEEREGAAQFRRRVYPIAGPEFPASRLLVGETYVESGNWSSYPPHKHDEDRYPEEVELEEVAFFQIDPPQGFGLQYLYTADRSLDEVHVVRNDTAFAAARGYHPIVAAPGYSLYYLWGMAGDGHYLRSSLDPAHAWVAAETGAPQPVTMPSPAQ